MKHISTYKRIVEEYAEDRKFQRDLEKFDQRDDESKRLEFDAEVIKEKLEKAFPNIVFKIVPYYNKKVQVVFLPYEHYPGKKCPLNMWHRDSSNYDDGVHWDFSKWLKNNGLEFSWRTVPDRYLGWHLYNA